MVAEGFAEQARDLARHGEVIRRRAILGDMARAVALGHHRGIRPLVRRAGEADGEGGERLARRHRGEAGHRAGIDAARKEGAERHIGHHPRPHRSIEAPPQCLGRIGAAGDGRAWRRPEAPLDRLRLAQAEQHEMPRRQAANGGIDGRRLRHVAEGQEVIQRHRIEAARQLGQRRQPADLRGEGEATIRQPGVVQRLFAQRVARQQQPPRPAVP